MRLFFLLSSIVFSIYGNCVFAYGDYPLPICHANGATIIDIGGINTDKAFIKGVVTKADLYEYCERQHRGESEINEGNAAIRLKIKQCVDQEYAEKRNIKYMATANCFKGTMRTDSGGSQLKLKFPDPILESLGCSAEYQYVVQFKTLCPQMAKRLKIKEFNEYFN